VPALLWAIPPPRLFHSLARRYKLLLYITKLLKNNISIFLLNTRLRVKYTIEEGHDKSFGLYTSNSIMDLAEGYLMLQISNNWMYLTFQLEQSTNLVRVSGPMPVTPFIGAPLHSKTNPSSGFVSARDGGRWAC
jgi:hypothetical protein